MNTNKQFVELNAELIFEILNLACDVMDKDEFSNRVDEVYLEVSNIIANRMNIRTTYTSNCEVETEID